MADGRSADGVAVPVATIQRADRVLTAEGVEIGTVRRVRGDDVLHARILVLGWDELTGRRAAYAVPVWAPQRREAATGCVRLAAHYAYVRAHWLIGTLV